MLLLFYCCISLLSLSLNLDHLNMSGSTSDQIAGPSSPRFSPPPSPSAIHDAEPSTPEVPPDTDTGIASPAEPSTPAPAVRTQPPSAPSPKIAPKSLPTATPLSSTTPTTKGPDISEFDPFATSPPAPATATPSYPVPATQGQSAGQSEVEPERRGSKRVERISVVPAISDAHTPATPSRREQGDAADGTPSRRRDGREGRQEHSQSREHGSGQDTGKEEPAFNFSGFLKDLRLKSAEPVARYLKR
jgi:hypothetical protein